MPISLAPSSIALIIAVYFVLIIIISRYTGKNADNSTFFLGNKNSPWYVVAYGMIGASLSGVTFISVPGWVASREFSYMQMVLGYLLGYFVIAKVLLPIYYKLNVASIYHYLNQRYNLFAYKSGATLFLISRLLGASMRLYIMASVLQVAVFDAWNVKFEVTVAITLLLIWVYTFRGGIKTIIWTDTLQTTFMLLAVGVTVVMVSKNMGWGIKDLFSSIGNSDFSRIWFFDDFKHKQFFIKQFLSGAFITIAMTGLDQDMMQKNLTCRSLADAQKNMLWFSLVLVPVNLLFLTLGALLYTYSHSNGIAIPESADMLYPSLATHGYFGPVVAVLFIIGLVAAAYSSADSALTALTTSFTIDILGHGENTDKAKGFRIGIHALMTVILFLIILLIKFYNDDSIISTLFTVAGYTYGPLLGMFAFGIFTKHQVHQKIIPFICVVSPILTHVIKVNSVKWLNGYQFDFEILLLNGLITFGLLFLSRKSSRAETN